MSDRREHVSVEQHEQLRRDFAALREQFEAADGVLSAMGRSAGDPEEVLTTIVESARRLCRSQAAHLYLLEDGVYRADQVDRPHRGGDHLHRRAPDARSTARR